MNKLENYDKCVDVIKRLSNDTVLNYICPICGNLFDKESLGNKTLTIDHVPPKSIGGKPLVLTCESCNKDLGSKLDSQIKNYNEFIESVKVMTTKKSQFTKKVKYEVNGYLANALCNINNSEINLNFSKKINNPQNINDLMQRHTKFKTKEFKFSITPDIKFHERYFNIGMLKSAYLVAFAKFGYTYIFHDNLKLVRYQIIRYNENIINRFIVWLKNQNDNFSIYIAEKPFKAILVQIQNALVVLPAIQSPKNFYEKLEKHDKKQINFETTQLSWSNEIELENDYFILKSLKNGKAILKNEAEAS